MTRPILTREQAIALAGGTIDSVFLLGIRGFFDPGAENKRGIYDDAIFLVTPDGCLGFNANTDPSITRKGIAVLQPGKYDYRQGLHGIHHLNLEDPADKTLYDKLISTGRDLEPIPGRILPYHAFRQAGPVTVLRDGGMTTETKIGINDWPWIDIHRGGINTTSSEGCQTIFPDQWPEIKEKGYAAMNAAGLQIIHYFLINKP